jgi:hypothetical protein
MKKLYLIILVIFTASFTFANPVINVTANGLWKNNSTWDLHRIPKDGDTVVIPAGKTVTIDDVQNLSTAFLYVKVYGILKFSGGKLWLNVNSSIVVYSGGSVTGTGNSSETLRIGGIDKYWGHLDTTIPGPAYADKTTGTSPIGFNFGFVTLPVKFIGFSLTRQNNNVLVEWATAQEINSSYFEVQRSENGNDWNTIAKVTAAGNTTLNHSYSYTDKNISAQLVYYRIRQVDIDGNFVITPVRVLKNENVSSEVSANVASNSIYLHFTDQIKTNVIVRLISMGGQMVSQKILNEPIGQVILPVENEMRGIYVVTITDGQALKFSKQILL